MPYGLDSGGIDYRLIAGIGPSYARGLSSGIEMLLQKQKILEAQQRIKKALEDEMWRKSLAQTMRDYYAKSPPLETGPIMQKPEGWQGVPYRLPERENRPWLGELGNMSLPAKVDVGATLSRNIEQQKKQSPSRVAADLALKSGQIEDYLHFERQARVEEDQKLKEARDAMGAIAEFREARGQKALVQAWPFFQSAYPNMLSGVEAPDLEWDDENDRVSIKVFKDDRNRPVGRAYYDKRGRVVAVHKIDEPTPEEERLKLEKERVDIEKERAITDYYKRRTGGTTRQVLPAMLSGTHLKALEDSMIGDYINTYGKYDASPSTGVYQSLKFATDKKGAFFRWVDTDYAGSRNRGTDPPPDVIKKNYEWQSIRAQQLMSTLRMPAAQAYNQAKNELASFYQGKAAEVQKNIRYGGTPKPGETVPSHATGININQEIWNTKLPELKWQGTTEMVAPQEDEIEERKVVGGKTYVRIRGEWYEED